MAKPRLYQRPDPKTGALVDYEPLPELHRPRLETIPPADPEVLARLQERLAMPTPKIPPRPRHLAQKLGSKWYWSACGCRLHGFPMLRRTCDGECILCIMKYKAARKAANWQAKQDLRVPLDELPRNISEAVLWGSKTYFTGEPCSHGHIAERYTRGRYCAACKNAAYVLPPATRDPDSPVAHLTNPPKADLVS